MIAADFPTGFDQARELLVAHDAHADGDTRRDEVQEQIVFAHLRDLWLRGQAMFFLLTPDVVDRFLDYEFAVDLSAAERYRVVDDVMNDSGLDDLLDQVNDVFRDLVRDHAQRVIAGRK